ncbi:hypothetical protein [Prochlorococcus marinus]|nr:hypothetical protein [Prochlorococcus marinus]
MALADLYNQSGTPGPKKTGRLRNLEGMLELLGEEAESLVDILSNIMVIEFGDIKGTLDELVYGQHGGIDESTVFWDGRSEIVGEMVGPYIGAGIKGKWGFSSTQRGLDEAIIPLLKDIKLDLGQTSTYIVPESDDKKAEQSIVLNFDASLNTTALANTVNVYAKDFSLYTDYQVIMPPLDRKSLDFDIVDEDITISFPADIPISFDLEIKVPSYSDPNEIEGSTAYGVNYSINPVPTSITMKDTDVTGLFTNPINQISDFLTGQIPQAIRDAFYRMGLPDELARYVADAVQDFIKSVTDPITGQLKEFADATNQMVEDAVNDFLMPLNKDTDKREANNEIFDLTNSALMLPWNFDDYPRVPNSLSANGQAPITHELIEGTKFADNIIGTAWHDIINGKGGDDTIIAGGGRDLLSGGSGSDIFQFISIDDSGYGKNNRDVITDFNAGDGDKVDLSEIGNDLTFIGDDDFSGSNQVRFLNGKIFVNTTNNKDPELELKLLGVDSLTQDALIL